MKLETNGNFMNYGLSPKVPKSELKPIFLPDRPDENWTYKGKLKPIYLPGQKE